MNPTTLQEPFVTPVDDEHARMIAYAQSEEGHARIEKAQAEIDSGKGIIADDAYFASLREHRAQQIATR